MEEIQNSEEAQLIKALHNAPGMACLVVTGAGISAVAALFAVAGSSRTVLEAQIPYSTQALNEYVGTIAESHVSPMEARLMAEKAHARALKLATVKPTGDAKLVGLSCTAAISTDRARRGENRCHISTFDGRGGIIYSLVMEKRERTRSEEEGICRGLILNALAEGFGLSSRTGINLVSDETVERTTY